LKPLLIGIDSLSYSSFMKCQPRVLLTLFNDINRGVVVNRTLNKHPAQAWLSILDMKIDHSVNTFLSSVGKLKLVEMTGATLVNIPITNPTYGEIGIDYRAEVEIEKEIELVKKSILSKIQEKPVIADITALDRILSSNTKIDKCKLYEKVDRFIGELLSKVDDFILFSPYGEPTKENVHEEHGVYLATVERPNSRRPLELLEISLQFLKLNKGTKIY